MTRNSANRLRIGVIQSGRIVEERLLREHAAVTIGSAPRNTIVVPESDLPPSFPLFPVERGRYALAFDDRMNGRLHGPSGAADLDALVTAGHARRRGALHAVSLPEDAWGKVHLGEVTVLFQLVAPPPPPPRAKLPRAVRGHRFRSMDGLFVLVLAASLGLHVAGYAGLSATPPREEVTLEEIPDRFAKLLIPDKKPAAPEAVEKKPLVAEKKVEEKKAEEKKEAPSGEDARPEVKAARSAAVARAVQGKGILRVLGSLGPGSGGAAVAEVFGQGGAMGDVAKALAGAGGARAAAEPGAVAARKGGGGGAAVASIGDLGTSGAGGNRVALGAKTEVQVAASVASGDAEIDSPDIDQAQLGAFVRARMGAIKACYESQLKRNPGLRGRIRVRFTILETGGLSEVEAAEDSVGSSEVASCIVATLRSWRTPFRPSAAVTIEYPFVFSANGS